MESVTVTQGNSPLILAFPHAGTHVPKDIGSYLNAEGSRLRDTDWHIARLYEGIVADTTMVRARYHRYCIDLNRPPSQENLYPGLNSTDLVPLTDFDGHPIWQQNTMPDATEVSRRITNIHTPYHTALQAEIDRVRRIHGVAILYDCHSIRSRIPYLFDGQLPDLNIGTNSGISCDARLTAAIADHCISSGYSYVVNGRFKGGWTTRHYGRSIEHVHAVQMEMAQHLYLTAEKAPFIYDKTKAEKLRPLLTHILESLIALAPNLARP